ncbi:MAG: AMP-binding protein, partial [Halioglobus sp.]|nr:AMP-binding protein [Halioglobus sp.]
MTVTADTLNLYASYAARFPAPDALLLTTSSGHAYSYGDAERMSARVANCLADLGLQPGDRVTVQVEKSVQNLWLFLGVIRAGLIYHPLNTAYTEQEVDFFLRDARPSLVVCDAAVAQPMQSLCRQAAVPHLHTLNADGSGSLVEAVGECDDTYTTAATATDDIAALVYSSGTTGRPKGIMLSHGNLVSNASTLVDLWGFSADDCLLHALPIYHVHG